MTKSRLIVPVSLLSFFLIALPLPAQLPGNATATGYPENAIVHGTEIESVQVTNGDLHVQIPIWSAKGRGLDTAGYLIYDNKEWYFSNHCYSSGICTDTVAGQTGSNMALTAHGPTDYNITYKLITACPNNNPPTYLQSNVMLREPDGTKHHFIPDPVAYAGENPCGNTITTTLYADDGSGWMMKLDATANVLYAVSKSGTKVNFGSIKDSNGNQLIAGNPSGTDTLGRPIYGGLTYVDSSGVQRSATISSTASVTVATHLCLFSEADQCTEHNNTWTLPASVTLPNGMQYSFTYYQNQGAEIASITLPTGGQISYTYGDWQVGGRPVYTRTVTSSGVSGQWKYTINGTTTTETSPDGNDTVYDCSAASDTGYPYISPCFPRVAQYYSGPSTSGNVIKNEVTDYSTLSLGGTLTNVIRVPIRSTTTWAQTNQVTKTETDWDTASVTGGTTTWKNVLERREFDWGSGSPGALIRKTHYSYKHLENSSYLTANIADRATSKVVYDGAGNIIAQTTYTIDGVLPTGSFTAPGHDATYNSSYNLRGNVTQASVWRNTDGAWLPTNYTYDILGNRLSEQDPLQHTTSYDYSDNSAGACTPSTNSYAYLTTTTDALGHHIYNKYYYCNGLLQATKDDNDVQAGRVGTTYAYDSLNRMVDTYFPDGGHTHNQFNDPSQIVTTRTASPDPDIVTTTNLEGMGRIGSVNVGGVQIDTRYDGFGRRYSQSNPHFGTTTDGTTYYNYDPLSRLSSITRQDGAQVLTSYSGNVTTIGDETGRQRKTIADGAGRIVEVDEQSDTPVMTAGSSGAGSVSISGTLKSQGTQGSTPGQAVVTVSSGPGQWSFTQCNQYTCYPVVNNGAAKVTVGSATNSTTGSFAPTLANTITDIISAYNTLGNVTASASGSNGILLVAKSSGSSTNYPLSVSYTWNSAQFSYPPYTVSLPNPPQLSGGHDSVTTYDSGSTSLTAGPSGSLHTSSYSWSGSATTTASIAAALCSVVNADSGAVVWATTVSSASPSSQQCPNNGSTAIYIQARAVGAITNYSAYLTSNSSMSSFSVSCGSSNPCTLSGGSDPQPTGQRSWSFSPAYVTQYKYDPLDNLTCVEQHGNVSGTGCSSPPSSDTSSPWRVRRFTYDSLSHLITDNNPESGTICYGTWSGGTCVNGYDNDGRLTYKTDARGVTITYSYDSLHRLTMKSYSDGSAPNEYAYDLSTYTCCGNSIPIANSVGRLIHISNDVNAASTYSYDPMGRITLATSCIPSDCNDIHNPVGAVYDVAGNLTSLTYPSGRVVNNSYDGAGRLYRVYPSSGSDFVNVSSFWPSGTWQTATFGNGTQQQDTYNNRLQPNELKLVKTAGGTLADKQYVWTGCAEGNSAANNGNVCKINDLLNASHSQTFNYDALNRVVAGSQTDNAFNQTFSYDPWGNIAQNGAPLFNPGYLIKNQISGYCYDAAGNVLDQGGCLNPHTYTFDAEGRLAAISGTAATYVYDADGNRVRKNVGSNWTEYLYFGGNVIAEKTAGGWTDYVFAGGKRIYQTGPSGTNYIWSDQLGSSRVTTDSAGGSFQEVFFAPFGQQVEGDVASHYKFNGKEYDSESTLDYFGARYYGSNMGRWISPDWAEKPTAVPYANFGNPQSLNLYSYVQNNPITVGDPDGHETQATMDDAQVRSSANGIAGGTIGLYKLVSGPWNMVAGLLNSQGQSSGQPYMSVPTLPEASYENREQAIAGAVVQTLTLVGPLVNAISDFAKAGAVTSDTGNAGNGASQLQMNKAAGDAFRDEVADSLKAAGRDVQKEVYKQTPFGPRRIDIEVSHNGKTLGGIETKTGNSPYKPSQRAKDTYLGQKGYPVNLVRKPKKK